ncbi:urea carboxylase-associated family protein [Agrobacterium deltaense]|uniref:urea carboxylase-associated family protein n=1 Tax=Agrobacterium deltaense TaxID=1183412 RepID=UPI001C6E02F9|nr:urea carboxylase-associated family protein [Agrobacterium deltaense]MBW9074386.1 urea carboxylase-associated family protein [Agrobacterium deltaense]
MTPMPAAEPVDAAARRAVRPVVVYPNGTLEMPDLARLEEAKRGTEKIDEVIVPPRDGRTFHVPKGHFFRIVSVEGPQVGDLNLWNAHDLTERFFSGKTRALHATHVSVGNRLWSNLPSLRPMATITRDTLSWYGFDEDGGGVHDVIGTRCDPYTNKLLSGGDYHQCCHSNLTNALASAKGLSFRQAEPHVHDVLNVFMCTGFTRDTHQYFMKASPVRPGDYLELFAEIDLIGALSACPGGDCSATHSSDTAACYPLKVEIFRPDMTVLEGWPWPERNAYRSPE